MEQTMVVGSMVVYKERVWELKFLNFSDGGVNIYHMLWDGADRAKALASEVRLATEEEVEKKKKQTKTTKGEATTPVYVAYAVPEAISEFVDYLKMSPYTLHVVCRTAEQVESTIAEYAEWSGGKTLPEEAILTSFDGSNWDREWFLIFPYSPSISYPFSILERGTGGGKRQAAPVAWHKKGRIESCYAAVAEQLVRAGLQANY